MVHTRDHQAAEEGIALSFVSSQAHEKPMHGMVMNVQQIWLNMSAMHFIIESEDSLFFAVN